MELAPGYNYKSDIRWEPLHLCRGNASALQKAIATDSWALAPGSLAASVKARRFLALILAGLKSPAPHKCGGSHPGVELSRND